MLIQDEAELHLPAKVNPDSDVTGAERGPEPSSANPPNVTVEDTGEGIVLITLRPGGRISAEDGTLVQERYLALTGGAGAAVLLQITGVEHVSREAVRYFSEAVTITAFAILGSTPVDRVIAHGRRGLPLPPCPSRYFSDKQDALAWLHARRRTAGMSSAEAVWRISSAD